MTIKPVEKETRNHLKGALLALALFALAGCGGGGGEGGPAAVNQVPAQSAVQAHNSFAITGDSYGVERATYLSATKSSLGTVLRAAIASSMTDPDYKTVTRIDIAPNATIATGVAYPLTGAGAFPGTVYFFNGHQSTLLRTVGGSITFTSYGNSAGQRISGSFSAVVEDGHDPARPTYLIAGNFDLAADSDGAVTPAPASLAASAEPVYQARCASCHALGSFDTTSAGASDLALEGGKLDALYLPGAAGHQGVTLTAEEIANLKVLLNVN